MQQICRGCAYIGCKTGIGVITQHIREYQSLFGKIVPVITQLALGTQIKKRWDKILKEKPTAECSPD